MQVDDVQAAIASARGSEPRSIMPIGDGWDHWTFLVDDDWVFRFPRREESARSLTGELRLLPELAARVDFAVPRPSVVGSWNGFPFMGYPRIDGRPLTETDGDRSATTSRLVDMVDQLHAFPLDRAADLLADDASASGWVERYERLAIETASLVAPLLARDVRALLERRFRAFLEGVADFDPVLVHGDLGPEHIRIDEESGEPVGLIDFGDATIGDAAIDYVGFRIAFTPQTVGEMAAHRKTSHTDGFPDRIDAYWWIGSVHAVLYGISESNRSIVDDGLSGLTDRLTALEA